MGEIPRVHRVEPPPAITGHALRVAGSGDKPGRERKSPERETEDQVELHDPEAAETPGEPQFGPNDPEATPIRLDIAV